MALFTAVLFSGAFTPSDAEIAKLDDTLTQLKSKDDSTLKTNATMIDKILSSHNVTGGYENENYRYIYYMNLNATDKLALFVITEIKNPEYGFIKALGMQENFILLIDANSDKKLIWNGYVDNIKIGIIVDSHIIGLRYISTSQDKKITKKGITNAKGEFEYFEGGTIEFYVGNIKIGSTVPSSMVAITTIADTSEESNNIAVFLQTIDSDGNTDNGIQISSSVDEHAKRDNISNLQFDKTFNDEFDKIKPELFKHTANIPETVSVQQALEHSSKSARLSSIKEFDLYKAIANEKNYGDGHFYNADILENDQRKRLYLWIWEALLEKEMAIEGNILKLASTNIDDIEEQRNIANHYIKLAQGVLTVLSLNENGTLVNLSKEAGVNSIKYSLTKLTSLTISGCEAIVKIYDGKGEVLEKKDNGFCTNMISILNPLDGDAKFLNPILSNFLPSVLPDIIKGFEFKWSNIKSLYKLKIEPPSVGNILLSGLGITNDLIGGFLVHQMLKKI